MDGGGGFYSRTWDVLHKAALTVRYWLHHHRWVSIAGFVVLYQVYAVVIGNSVMAAAATGDSSFIPPGWDATDSHGIPVSHYVSIPIDRGGWTDTGKTILAFFTDTIWVFHLFAISWALWLFDFILTFAWVDLIASPFVLLGSLIEAFFTRFEWMPFALAAAGLIGGFMIVAGRIGKGIAEMSMAVLIAVLAVMVYTNPAKALTATGGALDRAQVIGQQLTAIVTYDDVNASELEEADLSDAITAPVVDLLLRDPAQSLAFGRVLGSECAEVFDEAMLDKPPVADQNHVRDRVNDCSERAKQFNENPNFGQIISAAVIATSSGSIFSIPVVLTFLFFFTVFGLLVAAVKVPIQAHIAVLPFMRYGLWRSTMDIITGVASIVLLCISLAVSLKIILETIRGIDVMFELVFGGSIRFDQFPVARGIFIDLLIAVAIVFLLRIKIKAKKSGRTFAEQISKVGAGRGKPAPSGAVQALKSGMSVAVGSVAGGAASGLIKGGPAGAAVGAAGDIAKAVKSKSKPNGPKNPPQDSQGAPDGSPPPEGPEQPSAGGRQKAARPSPHGPTGQPGSNLPHGPEQPSADWPEGTTHLSPPNPATGDRYVYPDAPMEASNPDGHEVAQQHADDLSVREQDVEVTARTEKAVTLQSPGRKAPLGRDRADDEPPHKVDVLETVDVYQEGHPEVSEGERFADTDEAPASRMQPRTTRVRNRTRITYRAKPGGSRGSSTVRSQPRNPAKTTPMREVPGAVQKITPAGELRFEHAPRSIDMSDLANHRAPTRGEVRAKMTEFMRPVQR